MNHSPTDISASLRGAHIELLEDLRKLSQDAPGESLQKLRDRLLRTKRDLIEHFRFEEQNGYLDSVRKKDPGLEQTLNRLVHEHSELRQSLDGILAQLEKPQAVQVEIQKGVQAWVREVRGHEIRENDLIQDAFTHDLGAGD